MIWIHHPVMHAALGQQLVLGAWLPMDRPCGPGTSIQPITRPSSEQMVKVQYKPLSSWYQ